MADYSISLVPKISDFPNHIEKAQEILEWLISRDIIKSKASNCTLGSRDGYAVSDGARDISNFPEQLPFSLSSNGLEVNLTRSVFDTGQNGMEDFLCPACKYNLVEDIFEFIGDWCEERGDTFVCSNCKNETDINSYHTVPEWGFSNIGFTFWNWPEFRKEFIEEFRVRLGTDIAIVYSRI